MQHTLGLHIGHSFLEHVPVLVCGRARVVIKALKQGGSGASRTARMFQAGLAGALGSMMVKCLLQPWGLQEVQEAGPESVECDVPHEGSSRNLTSLAGGTVACCAVFLPQQTTPAGSFVIAQVCVLPAATAVNLVEAASPAQ